MNTSSQDGTSVDQVSIARTSAGEGTADGIDNTRIIDPREITVVDPPTVGEPTESTLLGMQGVPTTRQLSARRPLPFGLHCDRFALKVYVSEVGLDGGFRPPTSHIWNTEVVGDLLRGEVPEIHEVILTDHQTMILFFGRRISGEGLEQDDALALTQRLSQGYHEWITHTVSFNASPIAVTAAHQEVARYQTLARQRDEHRRRVLTARQADEEATAYLRR